MGVNPVSREVHIVIVSEKRQLSNPDNFSSLLLTLVALSGEFPASQSRRFSASETYPDFAVKRLKHDKLLRTYYNNGLRGLRLTAKAKKLLTADQPDQFTPLFVGDTMTSTPKYTIVHRLRLHRMAEVLVSMFNAGVTVFPWEKPIVFTPTLLDHAPYIDRPVYFSSCEVKNIGLMANKIRNSRSTGVLLTNDSIFAVYNTGASEMKWEHRAEIRGQELLLTDALLCGLLNIPHVKVYGALDAISRVGTVSFNIAGRASGEVADELDRAGICVRAGLHCAPLAHEALGTTEQGAVRASLGFANDMNDIRALLLALERIAKGGRL